jgi:hypothetical protein
MKMTVVFFPDPDGSGSLLFIGQRDDLGAFGAWLEERAARPERAPIKLDGAHGFDPRHKCDAYLVIDDRSDSCAVAARQGDRWQISWHISAARCRYAAGIVRSCAESTGRRGPHYFEESGRISIEVACGDWREGVWKKGVLKMIASE